MPIKYSQKYTCAFFKKRSFTKKLEQKRSHSHGENRNIKNSSISKQVYVVKEFREVAKSSATPKSPQFKTNVRDYGGQM